MEPISLRRVQMAFTDPKLPVATVGFSAAKMPMPQHFAQTDY
jgi:hypothetical protein